MAISLESSYKNKTKQTSDLVTLGQNLNFELCLLRQEHGITEMCEFSITSYLYVLLFLFIQYHTLRWKIIQPTPTCFLLYLKIIAGNFKAQIKVDIGLWVATESNSQSILRCPPSPAFPKGTVVLKPSFACTWFIPVCTAAYLTSSL